MAANQPLRFLLALALWQTLLAQPFSRVANTSLRMPQNPGGYGYQLVDALGVRFEQPVAIASPPGETNRLFVVEQSGRIAVVTNLAAPTRTVFLDLYASTVRGGEQGLLGLAFHPNYAANRRFFVFRTCLATTAGVNNRLHDRLSEFRADPDDPNRASPGETVLFQQFDEASNHNGGDLHFGPDGLLYVSLGDEGGGNDQYANGQRLDRDFFAGLLRLDVDNRPDSLSPNPHPAVVQGYRIPADNPFVGATQFLGRAVNPAAVRSEFYAVGLRNPWRFSFDVATGELWIADVGQNQRESVFVSRRGANHGWAYREGNIAGPRASSAPTGFLSNTNFGFVAPVHTYGHGSGTTQGNSITGGLVYRGHRLSALHGAYIFADYVSGNVWALRRRSGSAPQVVRLLGRAGLSAFGADPRNGDLLACDLGNGRILRLDYSATFTGTPLPATLAETGAFTDLETLAPAPGVHAYAVNLPFWSDHAEKRRWFCVPNPDQLLTYSATESWGAPAGTVWIKHFDFETDVGVPGSRRRLETRFLVRTAAGVYGATYRWTSRTDATLVPEEGAEELLSRTNGLTITTQRWTYPARSQCLVCHTPQAGHSLSFNSAQWQGRPDRAGETNQLAALLAAGYFSASAEADTSTPAFAAVDDESSSLEWRVRAYLAVNCAPCHRPGGTGGGIFDARWNTPTRLAGLVNGTLVGSPGAPSQRVLTPGDVLHSEIHRRLSFRGAGMMPPLASDVVDSSALELLSRWIAALEDEAPPETPSMTGIATDGTLRLQVRQPANQSLTLESSATSTELNWLPAVIPGLVPSFPATGIDRILEIPAPPESRLYRLRGETP